jgi:predicted nucleic acid-binding protein
MAYILDTSIVIMLCDTNTDVLTKVAELDEEVFLSIITQAELINGIYKYPTLTHLRKQRVDTILASYAVLDFDKITIDQYETIIAACGFSRRKILDRMIAAQALVANATLITLNPNDFSDIPNLKLVSW